MWRDPVNSNGLIAELRNTWMKIHRALKADCETVLSMLRGLLLLAVDQFPCLPEDWPWSSLQDVRPASLTSLPQDTSHCGMGRGVPSSSHRDVDRAESLLHGNSVWTNVWHWNWAWAPTFELLKPGTVLRPKLQSPSSSLYKTRIEQVPG